MTQPCDWQGVAFNQATESENRIHADDVARQYGFRGGLVPGVTVYAYLVHPAVLAWGRDWLERGSATILLKRPLYDGHAFSVQVKADGGDGYRGEVVDDEGTACAEGRVTLPETPGLEPPARRGDPPSPAQDRRPDASREALEALRARGMGALELSWSATGELDRYVRDLADMPEILRPDGSGLANPAFSLGVANWVLSHNVRLGPWIHVQSEVQHFAAIESGTRLVVEARVCDLFARGGHEFADLDVAVFALPDQPVLSARHRAIYVLRPG